MSLLTPVSSDSEEKRALDHRAFVAILLATLTTVVSVFLIFPFFASHGAEVNAFTTAILAVQVLVLGLWTHAARIYAQAKGYGRIDRMLPFWVLFVLALVANLLRGGPITSPMRGTTIYSTECAITFLILGLVGVGLTIAIATLPDRRRRALD